jgi:hypothetical protein
MMEKKITGRKKETRWQSTNNNHLRTRIEKIFPIWVWWPIPVIPALRRLRQEYQVLETSLGYQKKKKSQPEAGGSCLYPS